MNLHYYYHQFCIALNIWWSRSWGHYQFFVTRQYRGNVTFLCFLRSYMVWKWSTPYPEKSITLKQNRWSKLWSRSLSIWANIWHFLSDLDSYNRSYFRLIFYNSLHCVNLKNEIRIDFKSKVTLRYLCKSEIFAKLSDLFITWTEVIIGGFLKYSTYR